MIRFGMRMTLRGGREAVVRLLVTAAAVAVGVGLLLSVLGMYHAYQTTVDKPCWQCTNQTTPDPTGTLLWNYNQDFYAGRAIDRADVATLAPAAPVVPGLSRMPDAGQFYASPALAALLRTVPAAELGARFPGTMAGTIGPAGLDSPDQLVIIVGRTPAELAALPHTQKLSHLQSTPHGLTTSSFYRFGFGLGAVSLLVPMLVLIGTATRMAAARREERYAAMRLVGATRRQITVVASIDAVIGALFGAVAGIGVYALVHPLLARLPLLGARFFATEIDPTGWGYAGALVAVPVAAAVACLLSLRRVGISPIGVARRVTPPPPRIWRAIPLLAGLGLFCVPLLSDPGGQRRSPGLAVLSLILVMLGLMIAGPWLTMRASRVLTHLARGGSGLLAARRLADNPRAAFRAVSGVVMAVLIGTALAAIVPAAIAAQTTSVDGALTDVLRVGFDDGSGTATAGLAPATAKALIAQITAIPGTRLLPIYHPAVGTAKPVGDLRFQASPESVVSCGDLPNIPAIGRCPAGVESVVMYTGVLYTDNLRALNQSLPIVTPFSPSRTDDLAVLPMSDLLVSVTDAATLERVRTVLSAYSPSIDRDETPMTFGEVGAVRAALYLEVQRMVTIIAGITMLIAGCSLAIAVGSSIIDRKRPFTLLRVAGVSAPSLYRAVMLETVLPLLAATVVAAGVGLAMAYPVARALAPGRHVLVLPEGSYYVTLGVSLAVAVAVIFGCLPVLGRITHTDNARFE